MHEAQGTVLAHHEETLVTHRRNEIDHGGALLFVDVSAHQHGFKVVVLQSHPEVGRDPSLVVAHEEGDVGVGPGHGRHPGRGQRPVVHQSNGRAEFPKVQAPPVGGGGQKVGASQAKMGDGFPGPHFQGLAEERGLLRLSSRHHDLAVARHGREHRGPVAFPTVHQAKGAMIRIHLDQSLGANVAGDVDELVGFVLRLESKVNQDRRGRPRCRPPEGCRWRSGRRK